MSISASELEAILAERLDLVRKEKSVIRENIELIESKIKNLRSLLVQVPREKDEELVALLEKIEHTHNTTPQTNAAEREFMREKEKLRQKRKALASYNKVQSEVNELRSKLTDLRKSQAEKDDAINELHQGLRKVKVSNKTGCTSAEISERKFTVEPSKVARIVGRGGSNMRMIESDHGVSIEIDNNGGIVRVMGVESAIESAVAAIMAIVETSIEEFSLSDEIIVCLMMDKAQRVNDIQAQFGVRLDISRAKNLCKITGLTDNVTATKSLILSLQSIRTDVLMETSALSAIIGKGGASITALQEEFGVAINVNRERSTVEVVGMRPDVNAAVIKIKEIVETNKEVEEIIQLEKHVLLGCLMASGGQPLRNISKEFNVRVDAENSKETILQTIRIKGTHGKVAQAKAHIVHLVGDFLSNSLVFGVSDDVIPAILGKGGANIKAFRERYPDANIDIEGTNIHIQSGSEEVRASIKAEMDAIIDANYSQFVECSEETKSQLRSAQGADARNVITKELNVRLVVDGSATAVKLRGARADVLRAVATLEEFKQTHSNVKMTLSEEDYPVLLSNKAGEESIVKQFEARFTVEIRSNRKDLSLTINGSPENVSLAKAAFDGILRGDAKHGAQIIDLHALVMSALIGKGGANITKMESELGVKFDVVKATNQLRILGASEEKVLAARQAVHAFIHSCRITDTFAVPTDVSKKDFDAAIKRAADMFQTEIGPAAGREEKGEKNDSADKEAPKVYTIKGVFQSVLDCKEYLSQQFSGRASYSLSVLSHHFDALQKQTHGSLKRLQDKHSVSLSLDAHLDTHMVKVHGPTDAVQQAKMELLKLVEKYFPSEFALIELSVFCLREVFGDSFVSEAQQLGVLVTVDRAQSFVLLTGSAGGLEAARQLVSRKVTQWEDCHASIPIDPSVVAALVGKNGASINALRKETKVSIEINPANTSVEIKGTSKEVVQEARAIIEKRIHQLLSERWEISAPSEFLPILIGKQGANIIKLRADTGANIDIDGNFIKVHGAEEKVAAAKVLILDLLSSAEAKVAGSKVLIVPAASVAVIIGAKGATVRDIQDKTGVRFDFDRVTHKCSIKGTVEGVESAIKLVDDILSREGFPAAFVEGQSPPRSATPVVTATAAVVDGAAEDQVSMDKRPKTLPGAPPSQTNKVNDKNLSKSALKRLRRKQAQEGHEGESDDETDNVHPTASPALEPLEEVPETEEEELTASVPAVPAVESFQVHHSTPAPPASAAASVAPSARLGVIGKSSSKTLDPPPAAVATAAPVVEAPTDAPPSFPLNPSDQHHYHQQHLINLLLGDSPARTPARSAGNAGLYAPAPPVTQLHMPGYQPYNNAGFSYSTQPSSLYGAPVPVGPAVQQQAQRAHVTAPPGIDPARPTPLSDLSFAPAGATASHLTPPPPGLSPIGAGVNTSRFSFGDFNTSSPLNVPVLPQYQYQYQQPPAQTYAPVGSYTTGAAPTNATAAPAGNYYKSKSGFSVRL